MDAIRFETEVGADQVIRVPEGIMLPAGPADVVVTPRSMPLQSNEVAATRDWLLALATDAEQDPTPLPVDLAENHDYYTHGKPRE